MSKTDHKPAPRRRSGIEKPRQLQWRHHLAAWLIATAIRLVSATWRFRFVTDEPQVFDLPSTQYIGALWHNRLALCTAIWRRFPMKASADRGLVALISASHDGGMLSRALQYFGIQSVRGSSSRRGAQALLELTSWIERGYNVAITPDGPRGPKYEVHDGIIALAQVTGVPILPVTANVRGKLTLKSWDQFQIPLPFASCEVRFGSLLHVPRDLSAGQRADLKLELTRRLMNTPISS